MDNNTKQKELAQSYFERGYAYQTRGHLDRAAHCYRRSISFMPSAQAYTFLGWVLSKKGLYDDAIQFCKSAIEINPEYGNPYNDIGAYLLEQNHYDEALEWFNKALEAKEYENYCFPYFNIARIYEFKGRWDLAKECYEKAIKESADYEPAHIALKNLLAKYN